MSLRIINRDFFSNSRSKETAIEASVTIGVFDGIHLGHQELIKKIVEHGPNPTVVTFRENPKKITAPDTYEGDIFSLKQKMKVFEQLGIRQVVLIDFNENFSKLRGTQFLDLIEERIKMVFLAIGSNFRCGYQKDTNANYIKEMNKRKGIPTELVKPVKVTGKLVSSSRIKSAIIAGDLKQAAILLGRNVELDLEGLVSTENVYDLRPVHRIVPGNGTYSVVVSPGGIKCRAKTENGKVYLDSTAGTYGQPESLEFI
jgi:riboflavin kinase/FMN adenylyltransferase